jgi:hypothetical protein
MAHKTIGIAVHVDTYEGMKRVSWLCLPFFKYGIKASFLCLWEKTTRAGQ